MNTNLEESEIAEELGYKNYDNFSEVFIFVVGQSQRDYRPKK